MYLSALYFVSYPVKFIHLDLLLNLIFVPLDRIQHVCLEILNCIVHTPPFIHGLACHATKLSGMQSGKGETKFSELKTSEKIGEKKEKNAVWQPENWEQRETETS